jgi:hypothetical protein
MCYGLYFFSSITDLFTEVDYISCSDFVGVTIKGWVGYRVAVVIGT